MFVPGSTPIRCGRHELAGPRAQQHCAAARRPAKLPMRPTKGLPASTLPLRSPPAAWPMGPLTQCDRQEPGHWNDETHQNAAGLHLILEAMNE